MMNNNNYAPPVYLNQKLGLGFIACLFFSLIVGVLSPRTLAFLPLVFGLIFYGIAFAQNRASATQGFCKKELFFLILFLPLIFLSSLWSPDPEFSFERCLKITAIFIPALLLLNIARRIHFVSYEDIINKVPKWLIGLITAHIVIIALLVSEKMNNHFIIETILGKDVYSFKLNRSFVVISLLSIILMGVVQNLQLLRQTKIILLGLLAASTIGGLCFTESQTAQLGFLVGLIFLFAFPIAKIKLIKALALLSVLFCLVFPFTIQPIKSWLPETVPKEGFIRDASIVHRFEVWNFVTEQVFESPLYGQGIGAIRFLKSSTWMPNQQASGALHAHNAPLQIWAEFGVLGALLGCLLLYGIFQKIWRTENLKTRRLYLAVFMSCFACLMTGYGMWQSWLLGLLIALPAFAITLSPKKVLKKI